MNASRGGIASRQTSRGFYIASSIGLPYVFLSRHRDIFSASIEGYILVRINADGSSLTKEAWVEVYPCIHIPNNALAKDIL